MLPSFARDSIEVVHPVWVEDSRTPRKATYPDDAPSFIVDGCSVQPGASTETLGGRDTTAIRWTVFAPAGIAVEATDAVRYRGRLYRVDSEPFAMPSATGTLDHTYLLLIDWK